MEILPFLPLCWFSQGTLAFFTVQKCDCKVKWLVLFAHEHVLYVYAVFVLDVSIMPRDGLETLPECMSPLAKCLLEIKISFCLDKVKLVWYKQWMGDISPVLIMGISQHGSFSSMVALLMCCWMAGILLCCVPSWSLPRVVLCPSVSLLLVACSRSIVNIYQVKKKN